MGVTISKSNLLKWSLLGIAFLVPYLVILYATQYIDLSVSYIGFDWQIFYNAVTLEQIALKNPAFTATPWSVPLILPFTSLPYPVSWALALYLTILALIISVPQTNKRKHYLVAMFLVLFAYPSIRNFADLNLQFLIITGVLLSLWGYKHEKPYALGFGVLLAAAKPQEVFLLLFILGIATLRHFPWQKSLKTALIPVSVFMITIFPFGQTWYMNIGNRFTAGDITLKGVFETFNVPMPIIWISQISIIIVTVIIILRGTPRITRLGAGSLIVASLITAPYIAGLSHVTLFAIGFTTLVIKDARIGIPIFLLYFSPYLRFFGIDEFSSFRFLGNYLFFANVISWAVLLWFAHKEIQDYKLIDSTTKNEVINESNNRNIIR